MRYTNFILITCIGFALSLVACSEEENPTNPSQDLQTIQLRFVPMFGDQPLQLGQPHVNAADDTVQFTTLKFYTSEFALVNTDGSETTMEGLALIDFDTPTLTTNGYVATEVKGPAGTYRGIKFALGVPFDENHRDVSTQSEPLGPNSGMYWGWNPGYIFSKVEGRVDSMGTPVDFLYHTGEDNRRKTIRLASLHGDNITEFIVEKDDGHSDHEHNIYTINVDYSKFFARGLDPSQPMQVKMNPAERRNHVGPKDLADRTAANLSEMFSKAE